MLVAGASRHATDLLMVLMEKHKELFFFDDTLSTKDTFFGFPILKTGIEVSKHFKINGSDFSLATGNPQSRKILKQKLQGYGGHLTSIISVKADVGNRNVVLESGLNIMHNVFISNNVKVGEATLINVGAQIHHDCSIGKYCQISPAAVILGGAKISDSVSIGANATILPNVEIGRNAIVGAGSVVTKNVSQNAIVVGIPAQPIKSRPKSNINKNG